MMNRIKGTHRTAVRKRFLNLQMVAAGVEWRAFFLVRLEGIACVSVEPCGGETRVLGVSVSGLPIVIHSTGEKIT